MQKNKSILVFGGAGLQFSIIKECKKKGLFTIVIDPDPFAIGQKIADAFEVISGQDYESTCAVIEKYNVSAIVTAATDKPLVMMARVASKYHLPFFTEETAVFSTDKFQMKKRFQLNQIQCAQGFLIDKANEVNSFPVIVKPRDNSGSRGVLYCNSHEALNNAIAEAFICTKLPNVLVEEVIEGKEYSIEALHFQGKTKVIQFTEKITTPFPYFAELGHIQPAVLDLKTRLKVSRIIENISKALNFENCASHTELKINENGIFIIETSPRLGGDYITAALTPLSTGINMEEALIEIALGNTPELRTDKESAAGIFYFNFSEGKIKSISSFEHFKKIEGVHDIYCNLSVGSKIPKITNSLDRYGFIILKSDTRLNLLELKEKLFSSFNITLQ